jgi:hypothetical protein
MLMPLLLYTSRVVLVWQWLQAKAPLLMLAASRISIQDHLLKQN